MNETAPRPSCTPSGDVSLAECGVFKKCYKYRGEQVGFNATLDELYSEAGGFCDCYSFWGYDSWPNCDRLSSSSPIILVAAGVLPLICYLYLHYLVWKTILELKRNKKINFSIVMRGLLLQLFSTGWGAILSVGAAINVFAPLIDREMLHMQYAFFFELALYAVNFLPGMLIVPISWIQTVLESKKMKKKANFRRGKYAIRAAGVFIGAGVVALGLMGLYRMMIAFVSGVFICSYAVFWISKKEILLYAGDLMSPGIVEMMDKTLKYIGFIVICYILLSLGYMYSTARPSEALFRPAPLFYSGQYACYICMHVRLIKYFRYQCHKSLRPDPILREATFWERADKEKKEETRRKTVAFKGQASEIPNRKASVMGSRRKSLFVQGQGGPSVQHSGTFSSNNLSTAHSSSTVEVGEGDAAATGKKEKRRSLADSVQGILKMKRFSNAVRGSAARSSVDEETFARWKQAVEGGVSPGIGGGYLSNNPIYAQEKERFKARTRSTAGRGGRGGRGMGRSASRSSRGASASHLDSTLSSLSSNSCPLSAPIAEVDDDLENGNRSSNTRPSDVQL
mmetsp:Transcript_2053/g.3787  ORF Transcript_2053/g.3787 Transcript_2053/m.3787 type:complete len:567 (-) Transcript_2053:92-1792(-)